MRFEHQERLEQEIRNHRGPLKKPIDLLWRVVSPEDFVDSAVIGGVAVSEIVAGKIAESQIPPDVIEAFHAQYPQYGTSFVHAVNHLAGDPGRLMGLINGVKGKLFELDYVGWLNQGHLPDGWTASLAHHANNPAWDIAIRDVHGHIDSVLQLKATESLAYAHEAIAAHPDIDVVVPHELYERLAYHPDLLSHVIDGHETLHGISGHVGDAIGHAETAGLPFHFPILGPIIAIGFAVGQNYVGYRKGKVPLEEALRNVGERGVLAVFAGLGYWAGTVLAHEPLVGLPTSITVRLLGGQYFHNRRRRKLLASYLETVRESRNNLMPQLNRPLLGSGST